MFRYYFFNKKDNLIGALLWLALTGIYIWLNLPYIRYIQGNAELLGAVNPFYGAPFPLNLFNFDPSMEYGPLTSSIIHPLVNFISAPLTYLSGLSLGNLFYLLLQSGFNALSAVLLFYIMRRSGSGRWMAGLLSVFFGVNSYSLFTALIPDSYVYAQLVIVLSAAYLQKSRDTASFSIVPGAFLAVINFGITATNLITFTGALCISLYDRLSLSQTFRRFAAIMIGSLVLLIGFTGLQYILFAGKTWLSGITTGMSNGAMQYVSDFSFAHHSKVFHMLMISPVLTPDIALIDPGIAAFATDLSKPYPWYVQVTGFTLILMALLGFIRGIRTREAWSAVIYILFALLLHIVIGFGLVAYNYDMYLYAGHYLFAFFLLAAVFARSIQNLRFRQVLAGVTALLIAVTLVNNIVKHQAALNVIQSAYSAGIENAANK